MLNILFLLFPFHTVEPKCMLHLPHSKMTIWEKSCFSKSYKLLHAYCVLFRKNIIIMQLLNIINKTNSNGSLDHLILHKFWIPSNLTITMVGGPLLLFPLIPWRFSKCSKYFENGSSLWQTPYEHAMGLYKRIFITKLI